MTSPTTRPPGQPANMTAVPVELAYFGKLPSRGDFVRSARHPALLHLLDRWLSQTMNGMSADTGWKQAFDTAPAVHFAFLGSRSKVGLAGHLVPSQDASGRRYPFVTAGSFEVAHPNDFIGLSPLPLARLWTRLATSARLAQTAADLSEAQPQLTADHVEIRPDIAVMQAALKGYLQHHTVGDLDAQIAGTWFDEEEAEGLRASRPASVPSSIPSSLPPQGWNGFSVRRGLLALGLLLQPVVAQGTGQLARCLALPLPVDAGLRAEVAAFWLHLVARFVARWDVELAVFFVLRQGQPQVVIGFKGASAAMLRSVIDPSVAVGNKDLIDLCGDCAWVETALAERGDYGLQKLSGYLQDPQMSLRQAAATFREVFLGE